MSGFLKNIDFYVCFWKVYPEMNVTREKVAHQKTHHVSLSLTDPSLSSPCPWQKTDGYFTLIFCDSQIFQRRKTASESDSYQPTLFLQKLEQSC
jgi:hypothetical protein